MIFIAHRGNVFGPKKELENSPNYINQALHAGFHVEIDVWYVNNKFVLGHDKPEYEVKPSFLLNENFWHHAKNIDALYQLMGLDQRFINCFFHDSDECTLTSKGWIWTYPGKKLTADSVAVMPERVKEYDLSDVFAICSDYVMEYSYDLNFRPI